MILLQIIVLVLLFYIIYILSYSLIFGAPFAALSHKRISTILDLLDLKSKKKLIDLGSGDGRIVMAASSKGIHATGIEINPLIFLISLINLKIKKSEGKIFLGDLWKHNVSSYDYVTVWGAPLMMQRLEKKLLKELKPGAKVASNHFQFPTWKPQKMVNDVFLYIKK